MSDKPDVEPQVRVVDRRWWARNDESGAGGDDSRDRKPTYVEELEQQLADRAAQIQTFQIEHRRALDEFEQMRGRLRRDTARDIERARRALISDLLEVMDNLDRAIAAGRKAPSSALLEGVELVRQQFLAKLDGYGVSQMPALGDRFDAARHEAVTTTVVDDPSQDGVVVAVVTEGYAVGDDVLRPASVVVGQLRA